MTATENDKIGEGHGGGGDYCQVPVHKKDYHKKEYWNDRHAEDTQRGCTFDWLFDYTALRGLLRKYVMTNATVLNVGCGNSRLSLEWAADGAVRRIVDADFSASLIAELRSQQVLHAASSCDLVFYEVADVRDLGQDRFPNSSFDAVLDKATFDCIACNPTYQNDLEAMLLEVFRVLRPGGVFVLISLGDPESRLCWLHEEAGLDWTVSVCYIARRGSGRTDLNFTGGTSSCSEAEVSDEIPITDTGEWEEQLSGLTEDDYSFVYICRKSVPENVA